MNSQETGIRSRSGDGLGLRIGSLFSGVGGIELGLEAAGVGHVVYQVEIDAGARAVLEARWPRATRFEDVQAVEADDLPACDVLCGGFPCQDISVGAVGSTRAGLSGSRSGLWSHMARIVRAQRPDWIVVENVAHGVGKWLPTVVRDLEREGYSALPVVLQARWLGAPHRRARCFVLAHAHGFQLREQQQRVPRGRAHGLQQEGQAVALDHGPFRGWDSMPPLCRGDDGLPPKFHAARLRALGNAVVPQCAETMGFMIRELVEAGAR